MSERNSIMAATAVTALLAVLPLILDTESSYTISFLFLCFVNIGLAQAWNIIGGYSGQISLGQNAFFGTGAYVTGIVWLQQLTGTWYYFDPLVMFLSGLASAVLAVAIGIPLLSKLRGDYFALGTLGLGEILRVVVLRADKITGGSSGLFLDSGLYSSMVPYYFTGLFLALLGTATIYFTSRSRLGLALMAIKEDEMAASANGVHVLKYKVLAFAIGAYITGLCANLQAYYVFHIHPLGFFSLSWTLYPILMTVLGGIGTITGPVIGAFFLTGVFTFSNIYLPGYEAILSGFLVIVVMKFIPNGLVCLRSSGRPGERKVLKYALLVLFLLCVDKTSGILSRTAPF
jgi:branched-chain amino acid transport system permease protein